jgi:hypothetical protein
VVGQARVVEEETVMRTIRFVLEVTLSSQNEVLSAYLTARETAGLGKPTDSKGQLLGRFTGTNTRTAFGDSLDQLFRAVRAKIEGKL